MSAKGESHAWKLALPLFELMRQEAAQRHVKHNRVTFLEWDGKVNLFPNNYNKAPAATQACVRVSKSTESNRATPPTVPAPAQALFLHTEKPLCHLLLPPQVLTTVRAL